MAAKVLIELFLIRTMGSTNSKMSREASVMVSGAVQRILFPPAEDPFRALRVRRLGRPVRTDGSLWNAGLSHVVGGRNRVPDRKIRGTSSCVLAEGFDDQRESV
jgi:hypothetical protein